MSRLDIQVLSAEEQDRLRSLPADEQELLYLDTQEQCAKLARHDQLTKHQEHRLHELLDTAKVLDHERAKRALRAKVDSGDYHVVTPDGYTGHISGWRDKSVKTKSAGRPWQARDFRDGDEMRGRAIDALEHLGASDESIERAAAAMEGQSQYPHEQNELARRIAACADPAYARAFAKLAVDPVAGHNNWTASERTAWDRMLEVRAAMAIGAGATGGYMIPTHLDPSIILTNNGTSSTIRDVSRVVTLTEGNVWHGVSSTGVTASFDAEATEVSDDSPTLASPAITAHQAQAFVRASVQAWDDIANVGSEIAILFADAKERLEESKFMVGTGTAEPKGVFTAIAAVTASRVVSTTAATIGLVDVHATYLALPGRHRRRSTWVANPLYTLAVKALGTAMSASYTGDLRDPSASRFLDRPVVESDDAPATQTTTALDQELLLGDFSKFVIVDRLGGTAEFIPHLFGGSGRPTGERGVYYRWRTGSDVVDTNAYRVLVDKTSA